MSILTTPMTPQKDKISSSSNPRKIYPMPDEYWEIEDEMAIKTLEELAEKQKAQGNK